MHRNIHQEQAHAILQKKEREKKMGMYMVQRDRHPSGPSPSFLCVCVCVLDLFSCLILQQKRMMLMMMINRDREGREGCKTRAATGSLRVQRHPLTVMHYLTRVTCLYISVGPQSRRRRLPPATYRTTSGFLKHPNLTHQRVVRVCEWVSEVT